MASSIFALCTCGSGDVVGSSGHIEGRGETPEKRPVSAIVRNAQHTGYLMKQSAWLKTWRKRGTVVDVGP